MISPVFFNICSVLYSVFQGLNEEDFLVRYESAIDILIELEQLGYSAAVITQV